MSRITCCAVYILYVTASVRGAKEHVALSPQHNVTQNNHGSSRELCSRNQSAFMSTQLQCFKCHIPLPYGCDVVAVQESVTEWHTHAAEV